MYNRKLPQHYYENIPDDEWFWITKDKQYFNGDLILTFDCFPIKNNINPNYYRIEAIIWPETLDITIDTVSAEEHFWKASYSVPYGPETDKRALFDDIKNFIKQHITIFSKDVEEIVYIILNEDYFY